MNEPNNDIKCKGQLGNVKTNDEIYRKRYSVMQNEESSKKLVLMNETSRGISSLLDPPQMSP